MGRHPNVGCGGQSRHSHRYTMQCHRSVKPRRDPGSTQIEQDSQKVKERIDQLWINLSEVLVEVEPSKIRPLVSPARQ